MIKPEPGVNLNPREPSPLKDKAIFIVVLLVFLVGFFALLGWLIVIDKGVSQHSTAVVLVVAMFLRIRIG